MSTYPLDRLARPNSPQPEPEFIRAGDTVSWQRQADDYPPASGFMLSYTLVNAAATIQINGGMVTAGENFSVNVPGTTTATWAPGKYRWQAYIKDGAGNRYTIAEGVLEILANLEASTNGVDERTQDERILDNINAMIEAKSKGDTQRYRIFEREMQLYTWADVLQAKSIYEARVRAIRVGRGEIPRSRTLGVVFNNAR